jgi:hypothetical protein
LNNAALIASRMPDKTYVPAIIFLRPTVSKKWPMVSGAGQVSDSKSDQV